MIGIETIEKALREAEAAHEAARVVLNTARTALAKATRRHELAVVRRVQTGMAVERWTAMRRAHSRPREGGE